MRGVKAEGGWAVISTQECSIHWSGDYEPSPDALLWDDRDIPALALMAEAVHEHGALAAIELTHNGWDQHRSLRQRLAANAAATDRPIAGLIADLKQRGMLDETLIVWGGEFGRTVYCQGRLTADDYGRDHHPRCFSLWLAGGGIKGGVTYGSTDDYSYNITENQIGRAHV